MACLAPGKAIEATGLLMPVRPDEVALALEDVIPRLVNTVGGGDCPAIVAITDKFESCGGEELHVQSVPEAAGPIIPLEGDATTAAYLDSWLAKGTLLGADGCYSVFVVFLDVMRRPCQGAWTVQTMTILGTRQSVQAHLEELAAEALCA
jgi:hypothetical protein